jgi:hypothetical protein
VAWCSQASARLTVPTVTAGRAAHQVSPAKIASNVRAVHRVDGRLITA